MSRVLLFIALFALACSLVIEPGEERCSADEGCPTNMVCVEGLCRVGGECVEGMAESCNGVDDDCDGNIDEEQGVEVCNGADDDCDGMTDEGLNTIPEVCNTVDDDCDMIIDEDVPMMTDVCNNADDDCDGVIDEGRDEECNNQDDDCDGTTDEETDGSLCMGAEICRGQCVMPTCANDDSLACAEGQFCNTSVTPPRCDMLPPSTCENDTQCESGQVCFVEAGVCFDATPFGSPCTTDATCVAGTFCADLTAVGMAGSKTCTNTCCNDADCGDNAHCASSHLGARLCIPAQQGLGIGERCDAHEQCTSGYCRLSQNRCEAMCATDDNCADDEACVFRVLDDDVTLTTGCFLAGGRQPAGGLCFESIDCQSLFCNDSRCLAPCGTTGECSDGECTLGVTGAGQIFSVCFDNTPPGAAGSSCMSNDQCQSGRCNEGVCVAPCCSTAQCRQGTECQPIRTGEQWPTYCVPPN